MSVSFKFAYLFEPCVVSLLGFILIQIVGLRVKYDVNKTELMSMLILSTFSYRERNMSTIMEILSQKHELGSYLSRLSAMMAL